VTAGIEIRRCADLDEFRRALGAIGHFFGWEPDADAAEQFALNLPLERMFAGWDGDAIVAGAGAFPLQMSVPGGEVPTAGVTVVGVLPTHRRRGILTALMRSQFEDAREAGEPVAALWASEERIYGRFGFGLAALNGEIEASREHNTFVTPLAQGVVARVVEPEEALESFPPLYEAARAEAPGMMRRTRPWWELRVLADPPERRQGGGPLKRVLIEVDGRPVAYALYRMHASFELGVNTGKVRVVEALGATPQGTAAVWRYLLDIDWAPRVEASRLPVDHELLLLVAEPRRLRLRVGDSLWVRLVDVGSALGARTYRDGAVSFEVTDAFLPENVGRWRLQDGKAARTDAEADLRLDVTALGSAYLGGFTFAQLARAGRVEELVPGALERADAMFRTDRAPWCPEIF
jgi:predicted acetyltransferase